MMIPNQYQINIHDDDYNDDYDDDDDGDGNDCNVDTSGRWISSLRVITRGRKHP